MNPQFDEAGAARTNQATPTRMRVRPLPPLTSRHPDRLSLTRTATRFQKFPRIFHSPTTRPGVCSSSRTPTARLSCAATTPCDTSSSSPIHAPASYDR